MKIDKGKTIAVIGAGIVGVTLARRLQKVGYKVILFDPENPGMGASFGNAGYIAPDEIIPLSHGISPLAVLKMLMTPLAPLAIRWQQIFSLLPWFWTFWRVNRGARLQKSVKALTDLQKGALESWNALIQEEGLTTLVRKNGAMIVFETDQGFEAEKEKFPYLEKCGVDFKILSGDEARKMIPELSPAVTRAVFYPNGFHVRDPHAIVKKIFDAFIADGGTFHRERARFLEHDADTIHTVLTNRARYKVDAAVVTAGYQSAEFLRTLNFRVPLVAERGYHVVMDHKPLKFDMCFGSHERGFFITPMATGLRLAGTVEFSPASKNPPANWKRADILETHVTELLPGVCNEEKTRWMGHRPTLPDFVPVLGQARELKNLFLSFGHQHLGLTLAPTSADILAELISTGKTSLDLEPFDIMRFNGNKAKANE